MNLKTRRQRIAERARALGLVLDQHLEAAAARAESRPVHEHHPDLAADPEDPERIARELVQSTAGDAAAARRVYR